MALIRLRRQDLQTCLCSVILILINSCVFYFVNRSRFLTVLFAFFYLLSGMLADAFNPLIRRETDLCKRHLISSVIAATVAWGTGKILNFPFSFLSGNLVYGIWLLGAKKWMLREISPGWTMLLYDSRKNLEQARAVVESRKDLMIDACHCAYGGTEESVGQNSEAMTVSSAEDIDRIVQLFRVPQMVICLESGTDEVLAYCKKAGITAFVTGSAFPQGKKINREGLVYVRPVPAIWERAFGNRKNGAKNG